MFNFRSILTTFEVISSTYAADQTVKMRDFSVAYVVTKKIEVRASKVKTGGSMHQKGG